VVLNSNEVQNPTSPTAVTLDKFDALFTGATVRLNWTTALELNTLGYTLLRSETANRVDAVKVNAVLIAAKGASGGSYVFEDTAGTAQSRYWLVETELSGETLEYGPALVATSNVPVAVSAADSRALADVGSVSLAAVPSVVGTFDDRRASGEQTQRVVRSEAVAVGAALGAVAPVPASAAAPVAPVAVAPIIVGAVDAPAVAVAQSVAAAEPQAEPVVAQSGVAEPARTTVADAQTHAANAAVISPERVKPVATRATPNVTTVLALATAAAASLLLMFGMTAIGGALLMRRRRRG
jgi:hypothetical protein